MNIARRSGPHRLYAALWRYAGEEKPRVVAFVALLVGSQAFKLAIPFFSGEAVNAMQGAAPDLGAAGWAMALTFLACVAAWVLHGPGRVIERFVAIGIRRRFADRLYAHAVSLPLRWHERHHSGETIARIEKAAGALHGFSQNQFIYLQNAVNLLGPIAALFVISVATGGTALLGYAIIALVLVRFDRAMMRIAEEENRAERRYGAALIDCLGNIATVVTLRLEGATRRLLGDRLDDIAAPLRQSVVVNEAKWCAIDLLNNGLRSGLVVLYAWLVWREGGVVMLGTAVMVYQYAQQAGGVVSSMAANWQDLVRYQTDFAAADEVWTGEPSRRAAAVAGASWQTIRIEDLHFAHDGREGAGLHGVTLALRRGERIALVGESGSGKSTLLRVLAGLYEPRSARIVVDSTHDPGLLTLGGLATLIPQDPEIFESTLRHNVTMGLDYDEAAVRRAVSLACLDPVLAKLPNGIDTDISERGLNLSGGQKQRLALARGFLAAQGATILMLDEPTSSLDPATESRIYDHLFAEFPDACIISSVHRPHLLPRFDTVLTMAEGRLVDPSRLPIAA